VRCWGRPAKYVSNAAQKGKRYRNCLSDKRRNRKPGRLYVGLGRIIPVWLHRGMSNPSKGGESIGFWGGTTTWTKVGGTRKVETSKKVRK